VGRRGLALGRFDGYPTLARRQARSALLPGGWVLVELGAGSDARAREALTALDYTDIDVLPDLAGIGRVVVGRPCGA